MKTIGNLLSTLNFEVPPRDIPQGPQQIAMRRLCDNMSCRCYTCGSTDTCRIEEREVKCEMLSRVTNQVKSRPVSGQIWLPALTQALVRVQGEGWEEAGGGDSVWAVA